MAQVKHLTNVGCFFLIVEAVLFNSTRHGGNAVQALGQKRMVNHNHYFSIVAGTLTAFLGGCGGGSIPIGGEIVNGATTTSTATTSSLLSVAAEGLYAGTASNGRHFNTLVLENNQYYIIYGAISGDGFSTEGVITGTGQSGNGGFTSADLKDFAAIGLPVSGTLTGTFIPGVSFRAVVATSGAAITYAGAAPDSAVYNYNTPARLTEIAGTWNMTASTGLPASLNIAATGSYTGSSAGCNFSGTIGPRGSGKNVFDFTIRFGASPCALADQTATGHAVSYLHNGRRQLLVAGSDASRSVAIVLAGIR